MCLAQSKDGGGVELSPSTHQALLHLLKRRGYIYINISIWIKERVFERDSGLLPLSTLWFTLQSSHGRHRLDSFHMKPNSAWLQKPA